MSNRTGALQEARIAVPLRPCYFYSTNEEVWSQDGHVMLLAFCVVYSGQRWVDTYRVIPGSQVSFSFNKSWVWDLSPKPRLNVSKVSRLNFLHMKHMVSKFLVEI